MKHAVRRAFAQVAITGLVLLQINSLAVAASESTIARNTSRHALTIHGEPQYPPDFKHFSYVNPDAPKGGVVRNAATGTFDSLNPWIDKGTPAMGIGLIYDTLMEKASDEPASIYGLLAESVELAADNSQVIFNLRPEAKFHDGMPVTAEDVVFTFNLFMEKGQPFFKAYYADVERVEAVSKHQVRFVFRHNKNRELAFILGELSVLPKHYWEQAENDFSSSGLKPPVGSGPYRIKSIESGHSITYERDPSYWGQQLPVNIGRHNYGVISYDYYRDNTVSLQAFKADQYDFRMEISAKDWSTGYDFAAVKNGTVITERIRTLDPMGMQAFIFNIRRPPFDDIRVRQALNYAFDFEWSNRNLFYDLYTRTNSYFANSDLAASGLPSVDEKMLLEPYRDQLPAQLFGTPFELPQTDGSGNNRDNLKQALQLLQQAGWSRQDGKLINAKGESFSFEILLLSPALERVTLPFKKNLETLGIEMHIRTVDVSHYLNRVRSFDFDMTVSRYPQSSSPGNEQRDFWGSAAAATPGTRNMIGITHPIVDALIEKVVEADSRHELITACRALDRVLLWNHYLIPHWYDNSWRFAYKNTLHHPDTGPLFGLDTSIWWYQPAAIATTGGKADTDNSATTSDSARETTSEISSEINNDNDETQVRQWSFWHISLPLLVIIVVTGLVIRRRNRRN